MDKTEVIAAGIFLLVVVALVVRDVITQYRATHSKAPATSGSTGSSAPTEGGKPVPPQAEE